MPIESDESYVDRARRGPRLNELFPKFADIAGGRSGQARTAVKGDRELFRGDARALAMLDAYEERMGIFGSRHGNASMPYALESHVCLAAGLLEYQRSRHSKTDRPLTMWGMTAEATMERSLAHMANGGVLTFSCSPNAENEAQFYACGAPPHSVFYTGPFLDVTPEMLASRREYSQFCAGFDVIWEDTTFQMYNSERLEPIRHVRRNLRPDGILILLEKLLHPDRSEYLRREDQKDNDFKRRYFDEAEIEYKRESVLNTMENGQVALSELEGALRVEFGAAVMIWNSGNFYTVMASDDVDNLQELVGNMVPPAMPDQYVYETLPMSLIGAGEYRFRESEPVKSAEIRGSGLLHDVAGGQSRPGTACHSESD